MGRPHSNDFGLDKMLSLYLSQHKQSFERLDFSYMLWPPIPLNFPSDNLMISIDFEGDRIIYLKTRDVKNVFIVWYGHSAPCIRDTKKYRSLSIVGIEKNE